MSDTHEFELKDGRQVRIELIEIGKSGFNYIDRGRHQSYYVYINGAKINPLPIICERGWNYSTLERRVKEKYETQ